MEMFYIYCSHPLDPVWHPDLKTKLTQAISWVLERKGLCLPEDLGFPSDSLKPSNFQVTFSNLPMTGTSITFLLEIFSTALVEGSAPVESLPSNPLITFILPSHTYFQESYQNSCLSLQPLPWRHIPVVKMWKGCCVSMCANTLLA